MEPPIKLSCANCGKKFDKIAKEYRRQLKKGNTRFFCSLNCSAIKNNEENPRPGNLKNLRPSKKDEYTPFRWFVLRARYRDGKKHYGCDITAEYIKDLWEKQKGICPITGWNLILPDGTDKAWKNASPANASLDRIDNTKGYIQGNVRFVAVMANLARQIFTDEQLIDFCQSVVSAHPNN